MTVSAVAAAWVFVRSSPRAPGPEPEYAAAVERTENGHRRSVELVRSLRHAAVSGPGWRDEIRQVISSASSDQRDRGNGPPAEVLQGLERAAVEHIGARFDSVATPQSYSASKRAQGYRWLERATFERIVTIEGYEQYAGRRATPELDVESMFAGMWDGTAQDPKHRVEHFVSDPQAWRISVAQATMSDPYPAQASRSGEGSGATSPIWVGELPGASHPCLVPPTSRSDVLRRDRSTWVATVSCYVQTASGAHAPLAFEFFWDKASARWWFERWQVMRPSIASVVYTPM